MAELASPGHALKSNAAPVGAESVRKMAELLEQKAGENDFEEVGQVLKDLEEELKRIMTFRPR